MQPSLKVMKNLLFFSFSEHMDTKNHTFKQQKNPFGAF